MELDKKRFSIRRHITLVLTLFTVLIVLLIGVCVAVVREQSRIRLTSAADSYLSLLTRTLEKPACHPGILYHQPGAEQ